MNRRILPTTSLLVALLLGAGLAAAGVAAQAADGDAAQPAESNPAFLLKADPAEIRVKAGMRGVLKVVASADEPTRLGFALFDPPRFPIKLSTERMALQPGMRGIVEVGVFIPEGSPAGAHRFGVSATSASGETQRVHLAVHVVADEPAPSPAGRPSERPSDRPMGADAERPAFRFTAEPTERRTKGGERLEFILHAAARENLTLDLRTGSLPRGYAAHFESPTLEVVAGERAHTRLVLAVTEGAPGARIPVHALAREGEGRAQVILVIHTPTRPTGQDDAPAREPGAKDRAPDGEEPRKVRMILLPPRVSVGPDGGRVPLLIQAGNEDVVLKLAPRHEAHSGWRVNLEQDEVKLPAHGRTWLWVQLLPGDDADRALRYAILGSDGETRTHASGLATVRAVRTA